MKLSQNNFMTDILSLYILIHILCINCFFKTFCLEANHSTTNCSFKDRACVRAGDLSAEEVKMRSATELLLAEEEWYTNVGPHYTTVPK